MRGKWSDTLWGILEDKIGCIEHPENHHYKVKFDLWRLLCELSIDYQCVTEQWCYVAEN